MAAAVTHKFLLTISIALFLSAEAQHSYDDQDGNAAVSQISSTPTAAPAAAPAVDSSVSTDSFDASLAVVDSSDSDASWGTKVSLDTDTEPISHDVPAAKRSSVNLFMQSTMQASVAKTDNFIAGVIEKRLEDPKLNSSSKECLQTCKEVYEDSVNAMKKTLEDIHEGNYYKANVDVSAMSNDADTCKDCVKTVYGSDPELDRFNKWVDGVIDQCLTMITGQKA